MFSCNCKFSADDYHGYPKTETTDYRLSCSIGSVFAVWQPYCGTIWNHRNFGVLFGCCHDYRGCFRRNYLTDGIGKHLKDAKLLEKEGIISKSERLHAEVAYADAMRDYKASLRDANVIEEGLKTLIKAQDANLKDVCIQPNSLLFVYDDSTIDIVAMKENVKAAIRVFSGLD